MAVSGQCAERLYGAPHQLGCALRCVRKDGHEGLHWFKRSKPTKAAVELLKRCSVAYRKGEPITDQNCGPWRTVDSLRRRGLLAMIYVKEGPCWFKPTARGMALIHGEDVR